MKVQIDRDILRGYLETIPSKTILEVTTRDKKLLIKARFLNSILSYEINESDELTEIEDGMFFCVDSHVLLQSVKGSSMLTVISQDDNDIKINTFPESTIRNKDSQFGFNFLDVPPEQCSYLEIYSTYFLEVIESASLSISRHTPQYLQSLVIEKCAENKIHIGAIDGISVFSTFHTIESPPEVPILLNFDLLKKAKKFIKLCSEYGLYIRIYHTNAIYLVSDLGYMKMPTVSTQYSIFKKIDLSTDSDPSIIPIAKIGSFLHNCVNLEIQSVIVESEDVMLKIIPSSSQVGSMSEIHFTAKGESFYCKCSVDQLSKFVDLFTRNGRNSIHISHNGKYLVITSGSISFYLNELAR